MGNFNMGHSHGGFNNKPVIKEEVKSETVQVQIKKEENPVYPHIEAAVNIPINTQMKTIEKFLFGDVKTVKMVTKKEPVISKKEIVKKVQVKEPLIKNPVPTKAIKLEPKKINKKNSKKK